MPNMDLSSLSSLFNSANLAKTVGAFGNLASSGAGLYNSYENNKYQDLLRSYAESPQKFQQYAAGFTKPLTAGLQEGVANSSQAYAAERGLATSPALEQQIQNQAIAPYIQQNQQQGQQAAFQALGLGGGAQANPAASFGQLGTGLSGLLKLLSPGQSPSTAASNAPATGGASDYTSGNPFTGSSYAPPPISDAVDLTSYGFNQ